MLCFKEKLKQLKGMLKSWNTIHFCRVDQCVAALHEEIHSLDVVDDVFGLTDEEVCRRNEATAMLLR